MLFFFDDSSGGGGSGHRYWRLIALDIPTVIFEISEIQLFEGATQRNGSISSFSAVSSGSPALTNLNDNNLNTRCYWTSGVQSNPSFWIKFDLGANYNINGVKQGGFDASNRYMRGFTLQYSDDDSTWTTLGSKSSLTYPGNFTLSSLYSFP